MKTKNKFLIMLLFSLIFMCNGKAFASDNSIKQIDAPKNPVAIDKKWKINFSKQLDKAALTKDAIKVLDKNGQAIDINLILSGDEKSVEVVLAKSKYTKGETYSIVITNKIKDKTNKPLKQETRMSFTIENGTTTGGSGSSSSTTTSENKESTANINPSIKKAREGLVKIKPLLKTENEKQLVDYLINTIDERVKNPSYKINSDDVKKRYRSLSSIEQQEFKNLIESTFTIGELMDIREALGV
ncbi:Ig-like domain-containing protein [Clostridium novyi]|uniref:Putative cell wall hydrolase n=2 Tax=Clostridium novyi TaxID=1542 RepID=A0PZ00_CLONN|nr:Ig-like domain-containing protein [Clostridium novyi]ABK60400.1 putative cell wall hydrolase [Clostridium novyi NT]KEH86133.1 cell wall hydrolase [Clostridium novyi A str. NCTC 538]